MFLKKIFFTKLFFQLFERTGKNWFNPEKNGKTGKSGFPSLHDKEQMVRKKQMVRKEQMEQKVRKG